MEDSADTRVIGTALTRAGFELGVDTQGVVRAALAGASRDVVTDGDMPQVLGPDTTPPHPHRPRAFGSGTIGADIAVGALRTDPGRLGRPGTCR
jgi:hypothetical protein